ncbi:gfo/Idh/MocA family oxidoreductase [Photobacterium gaetbulicola]|uniref:Gfo/Idh/MocA-like oxidoreductase N-terminal domain-containing protein n=1 Tax=Photobacterium gaetbulicola Gung47 TaxID=658445 RepID=A0A0C5WTW4_9GAMM|nr:Gfo/Idh/MocA family oxidoreductase [Photobacterium gaetbulicola]AJR06490.1 hypothetical protein H744_1c1468 [Photobacterium gaetbulicola Gung47]PSU02517.1 gfo/Idh/MocA family oxidoreductase [Photobacterium gaetbulicola]
MTSEVLNIGLIGMGEAAQTLHLPTLFRYNELFKVVAGQDISPTLVNSLCQQYQINRAYSEPEDVIKDDNVDAVIIMSPDPLHYYHARLAIENNKHILLEKPSCLQTEHIEELVSLAEEKGVKICVAYMRAYSEAFLQAEQQLKSFGEIKSVRVKDLQREGDYYIPQVSPTFVAGDYDSLKISTLAEVETAQRQHILGKKAHSDLLWKAYRVLTGAAIHNLSALRMLLGEPEKVVSAYCNPTGENIVMTLDYGHFFTSYEILIDNLARVDASIEVTSESEMFRVNYTTPYIRNLPTTFEYQSSIDDQNHHRVSGPFYRDQFTNELLHFHSVLTEGGDFKTTLSDSLKDIQLAQRAVQCIAKALGVEDE